LRRTEPDAVGLLTTMAYLILMLNLGRRAFVQSAMATFASIGAASFPMSVVRGQDVPDSELSPEILKRARAAFARHDKRIWQRETMAIADFSVPSRIPRFHLLNMISGETTPLLVAHGKGSDPDHSGWVQHFSNVPGSEATSSGSYIAGESYIGQHGLSRRLIGLDPENDQAENRAIVIHAAWYVNPALAEERGKIGRSQGCFAFSNDDIGQVLWRLGPGSLLYADKA
jgi:L,D-transpeptidase catalytic domain